MATSDAAESDGEATGIWDRYGFWIAGSKRVERAAREQKNHASDREKDVTAYRPQSELAGSSKYTLKQVGTSSHWWKYAIIGGLIRPIVMLLFLGGVVLLADYTAVIPVLVFAAFICWMLLPVSMYKDSKHIGNADVYVGWNPSPWLYALGTLLIPFPLEWFAISMYMYRRHRYLEVP